VEITHRELRNDTAEIIRGVERGESYTVTKRGVPMALLTPIPSGDGLRLLRPPTQIGRFSEMKRARLSRSSQEILDDLRGDR